MLNELIDLLKYAPSGGNLQPWILKADRTETTISLSLSLDPKLNLEQQHTDHCGYGALVSLGILAYSIEYLSSDFGFRVVNKTIHSENELYQNSIFISLEKCEPTPSQRSSVFRNRFTDRRPFEPTVLASDLKKSLVADQGIALHFFENTRELSSVEYLFRQLSLLRFQNKEFSNELSHELKSDTNSSTGIPISNLGLSPLLSMVTRFQKKFPLRMPISAAYSWPIYESISRPIKHSPTIACLKIQGNSNKSWILLGEKFMNVWLKISEAGGRLQPFGNTLTIANFYQDPTFFTFSKKQREHIESLHSLALKELKIETKDACLFFRLGYSQHDPQETPRKNIQVIP